MDNGQTVIIEAENNDVDVTVIDNETGAIVGVETEAESEQEMEDVEAVVDSAVAIAEIEADKDIAIAELAATVELAKIEAETNEENESELSWLKNQMETQGLQIASLAATVEAIAAQLIPPPLAEMEPETIAEVISPSESVEGQQEVENQEAEPEAPRRRIRAI